MTRYFTLRYLPSDTLRLTSFIPVSTYIPIPLPIVATLLSSLSYCIPEKRKQTTFHTCLDCFYAISQPFDKLIYVQMTCQHFLISLGVVLILQLHGYLKGMRRNNRENKIRCRLTIRRNNAQSTSSVTSSGKGSLYG